VDRVVPYGHATVLIEVGGARLLTDPLFRDRIGPLLKRRSPAPTPAAVGELDAVLISHWHRDHLDRPSLRALPDATPVLAPHGAADVARRAGMRDVREVGVGDSLDLGGARVTAVRADHGGPRNPLGRGRSKFVGYLVEGPSRVYFAGDTSIYDEMAELAPLDVALVPVAGWGPALGPGHMNSTQAADSLKLLRPRIAIPIHWGQVHVRGTGRGDPGWLTKPGEKFARRAGRVSPETEVRIPEPGEPVEIPANPVQ
jgi:L-ascorbate metabolism protein UlaG (beta-lactamase superfamily)